MKPFLCSPESAEALQREIAAGLGIFTPKPPMTLSEWADEYAYIPAGAAEPGKFSTATAEYQREPMDAISDPRYRKVVLIWSAQTGKTQIQLNAMGYFSHQEPAYMMMIQPTIDRAEEVSKTRIAPMIRDTPVLRDLFPDPKSRDSGNTLHLKEFPGGFLALIGANAPSGLASKAVRVLLPDEVDRFPESAGTEGDSLALADVRGSTYWNFKSVPTSTPLIKGTSVIESEFGESDQRYYLVPCPHCGLEQVLMWSRLKYEKELTPSGQTRPKDVHYDCINGCRIDEGSKYEMVRRGRWQASGESRDGRTAGFHLNALYSPWVEWTRLVLEWLSAQADPEKLQVFTNTRLAESWELRGDGAEETELEKRQEPLPEAQELPDGVLLLTLGVDVQRDRVEATLWGWGMGKEGWALDHFVLRGTPALPEEHPESPWRDLDDLRARRWKHPAGKMLEVACVAVDSGDQTKIVNDYTRRRERQRVHSIKGIAGFGRPLVNAGTRPDKNKTLLYMVGVDTAKERIYSGLKQEQPGPGYIHILKNERLGSTYLQQLTAEHIITTRHRGRAIKRFEVLAGRRNEALDCAVYASAAREILRPNFDKLYERLYGKLPVPVAVAPLVEALKVVSDGIREAFAEPKPISSPPPADPWADLPVIGTVSSGKTADPPANWRDSWKIF